MLADFFANRDEGRFIEFDNDEYMTVAPIGSLPRSLVDEMDVIDGESDEARGARNRQVRAKQHAFLIKDWLIRDGEGNPYPHPATDLGVFDRMDRNLDAAISNVLWSAFDTKEDKIANVGEE